MELHFTLISAGKANPCLHADLVAEVAHRSTGRELAAQLRRDFGVDGIMVNGQPLESLVVGEPPLQNGALLLSGEVSPLPPWESRLELVVRSGPAAGSSFPLKRGLHLIGRSRNVEFQTEIMLPDPDISRDHAHLIISEESARVVDLGSANGTWVKGQRVSSAKIVVGEAVRVGSTMFTLEFADHLTLDASAGSHHGETLHVERSGLQHRGTILGMTVLPLTVAIGMALATGQWTFLAFASISVATALITVVGAARARRSLKLRLNDAVKHDAERRRLAAPDASDLCRSEVPPAVPTRPCEEARLRLGTARQKADVVIDPPGRRTTPEHPSVPFTVPLMQRLSVQGPLESVEGMARFVLLQLATAPAASGQEIVLAGGSPRLRRASRYLPRVRILPESTTSDPEALAGYVPTKRGVLLLLPGLRRSAATTLVTMTSGRELAVIDAVGVGAFDRELRLGTSRACLRQTGSKFGFIADLVPAGPFEMAARKLGACRHATSEETAPARCGLDEIIGLTEPEIARAWRKRAKPGHGAQTSSLWIPLGRASSGTIGLDLIAEGPHVLIAGTTGAGKSELLRTIVSSAAAAHSPCALTFLFLDFKGGSGLAPLVGLPHCVGMVTDLEDSTGRTLASLRAELARRERLFADNACTDLADYAARGRDEPLPRLIIVVDEFRMLLDSAPESLAELLRIATIGRSLGIHLLMATQRPQGAISADIRANIASTIALRVSSELESRDVLGTPDAASIRADRPGRALLRAAGRGPVEFQTASLSLAAAQHKGVRVVTADEWLNVGSGGGDSVPTSVEEASEQFVTAVQRAWDGLGVDPPRRPIADPLAEAIGPGPLSRGGRVPLGIVDLPHEQRTSILRWTPEQDGHLALIGAPISGARSALKAVVAQVALGASERHLYLLDGDGSLAEFASHPRVGASIGLTDLRLASRLIKRLEEESGNRLSSGSPVRSGRPPLLLVISAWGSWISAWRQSPQAWAEERLLDLIRDSSLSGITVIASGERELTASRAFAGVPCRIFFPWGSTEEARLGWPRPPQSKDHPGRAVVAGVLSPNRPVVVQCFDPPTEISQPIAGTPGVDGQLVPFKVRPLPAVVDACELANTALDNPERLGSAEPFVSVRLTIGLHGDDASPFAMTLAQGSVLLVLGSPGSGKSSFLKALPVMNRDTAVWCERSEADGGWTAAVSRAIGHAESGAFGVLLVDDADRLSTTDNQQLRRALDAGVPVVATAGFSPSLFSHCPLALHSRSTGVGIAIRPRMASDSDVWGVRLDPPGNVPPGRAIAVIDGKAVDVQLGWAGPSGGKLGLV